MNCVKMTFLDELHTCHSGFSRFFGESLPRSAGVPESAWGFPDESGNDIFK